MAESDIHAIAAAMIASVGDSALAMALHNADRFRNVGKTETAIWWDRVAAAIRRIDIAD